MKIFDGVLCQVAGRTYKVLWWFFIKFKKIKEENHQEYLIRYKELWGEKLIIEVRPKYF